MQNSIYHGRRIRCRPTGTPRRLTVIAQTDARLAVVRAKPLHGLLKKHPEWWRHLAVVIGTILRSLQDAGLISIGSGKIRPLQPEKLRALVEAE